MFRSLLAYMLILYYSSYLTICDKIEISEICEPTKSNNLNKAIRAELPRPWTLNSTLTILARNNYWEELSLKLYSDSSKSKLRITFDVNKNSVYVVKSISEGYWFKEYKTTSSKSEEITLSLTRQADFYQLKINGIPLDGSLDNETALQVEFQEAYDKVEVDSSKSAIKNVCFWNTTNIIPSDVIYDSPAYSIQITDKCTAQGDAKFPDEIYKRYIGQSLTENSTLTFVGDWSDDRTYLDIFLLSNTTESELSLLLYYAQFGDIKLRVAAGNHLGSHDFEFEIPQHNKFTLSVERHRTYYEIKVNGHKQNIPEEVLQINPEDVHNQLFIDHGGRTLKNICFWKSSEQIKTDTYNDEIQEKDLPRPLKVLPVAVVERKCLKSRKCEDCLFYAGPEILAEKFSCNVLIAKAPYLAQVENECRLIPQKADNYTVVNPQFCVDAISLKMKKIE